MDLTETPPIKLSPVTETAAAWQYLEGQTPVDFTQITAGNSWSAEFLIENCGAVMFRTAAELGADGGVAVTIPASASATIRSARRIDATYQVRFTAPTPEFDMVWRGPAVVLEITE